MMVPEGSRHGFTLIEIAVVILLISIMLLVTLPRLPDSPLTDQTRKTKRWIILKVKDLKEQAVRDQKTYTLNIGLESNRLWATNDGMAEESLQAAVDDGLELQGGMALRDVEYPGAIKIDSGLAEIRFFPKGYSDRAIIHMDDGERFYSFQIEPFLSTVKVYDGTIGFEE
jgi:prepilin-type N-terminal cleavage/methylation domain-containing protein